MLLNILLVVVLSSVLIASIDNPLISMGVLLGIGHTVYRQRERCPKRKIC